MFAGGMTLGLVFDLYRLFRMVVHTRGVLDWFFDILFWTVTAPVLVIIMFYGNWGELRLYVLVAISLGAIFYFRVLSRPVRGMLRLAMRVAGAGIRLTVRGARRVVIDPVLWLWDQGVAAMDRQTGRHRARVRQKVSQDTDDNAPVTGDDDGS